MLRSTTNTHEAITIYILTGFMFVYWILLFSFNCTPGCRSSDALDSIVAIVPVFIPIYVILSCFLLASSASAPALCSLSIILILLLTSAVNSICYAMRSIITSSSVLAIISLPRAYTYAEGRLRISVRWSLDICIE